MGLIRIINKRDKQSAVVKMPSFYMNDFSMLGLVVDQFEKTIHTLKKMKCDVKQEEKATWVSFDGIGQMQVILSELKNEKISFSVSDIVSCAYQG